MTTTTRKRRQEPTQDNGGPYTDTPALPGRTLLDELARSSAKRARTRIARTKTERVSIIGYVILRAGAHRGDPLTVRPMPTLD